MRIIPTKKSEFTSKKNGVSYVKISYISPDGSEGMFMAEASEYLKMKFPEGAILTSEDLTSLFTDFKTADVEFNSFGRVIAVK